MGNRVLCNSAGLRCTEKCTRIGVEVNVFDGYDCDPAGAVFDETLQELNDVDRQLLLFASSTNLAAVRWLLELGASQLACDKNATTCLHAACRSGSPAVVSALVGTSSRGDLLDANVLCARDISGWTPLHTAAFMGRHDVVAIFLRAGAAPDLKSLGGQTAASLCSDPRTRSLLDACARGGSFEAAAIEALAIESATATEEPRQPDMRYEPFFVPRNPVLQDPDGDEDSVHELTQLGQGIFSRQPGRGLAFLVAAGCARDYPLNLVAFLRRSCCDLTQIGNFLGEAFSLSNILRLEFLNSISFMGTGVVSGLAKAFTNFRMPPDLQKIDRIVKGLAEVWWRQHGKGGGPDRRRVASATQSRDKELEGHELAVLLLGPDALHRLMFSAVMLHWNLHAPLPSSQRLSLGAWRLLNAGAASGKGGDIPEEVLAPIYRALSGREVPALQIGSPQGPGPLTTGSAVAPQARIEGWGRIIGGRVPVPQGLGGQGTSHAACSKVSHLLSEATASSRRRHPDSGRPRPPAENAGVCHVAPVQPEQHMPAAGAPAGSPDAVWLSLCRSLLFFSSGPGDGAPFAFAQLKSARLANIEPGKGVFSVDGGPRDDERSASSKPVQMVFLLMDGRWQTFDIPLLEIEVCDRSQLEPWILQLSELCQTGADNNIAA